MSVPTSVKLLQEFFLKAACLTYVSGLVPKTTIPELPGSKCYRFGMGDFFYVDIYHTNGEQSGGETVLWVAGQPAWLSQYHGWCKDDDKDVLAMLKRALAATYTRDEFVGGRGPDEYFEEVALPEKHRLAYRNSVSGDFSLGQGREEIRLETGELLFWHKYQHILLAA